MDERRRYDDERSPKTLAFLAEIAEVCRKYGLSLAHEDSHGGFIVEPLSEWNLDWVAAASEDL